MANRQFLPEYGVLPVGGRYSPMFRLFVGDRWHYVRRDRKPVYFDTASQAIAASKAHVQRLLNPEIRSQKTAAVPDVLGDFRARKLAEAAADQEAALGAVIVKGRPVQVERRKL